MSKSKTAESLDLFVIPVEGPYPGKLLIVACVVLLFATTVTFSTAAQDADNREPFAISNSYQNLLSNSEQTGILDRVFMEAFGRIGITPEIVFTPTEQSLVDVNAGVLDAEANRIAGMEYRYPNLRRVPEPNMQMQFVAFATRQIPIDDWESLRGLDVGLLRGWKILEDHTSSFPNVTTVPTEVELFSMLRKDRIDVALYSKITGYAALVDLGIQGVFHLEPPLAIRDMYMYVHKDHEDLLDPLAAALRAMKSDGTYQEIVAEVLTSHGIMLE